jgi:hypothetical protein
LPSISISLEPFAGLLERIRGVIPAGLEMYLVGGAVRDALLGNATHDLDFALPGDAPKVARQAANALGGAYYLLDGERGTGRVILTVPDGDAVVLDFARFRGPDLESDLRARDFTINAMAVSLDRPDVLIDPLEGRQDLLEGRLRLCSPTALMDDPLRTLRAYRLKQAFDLQIGDEARKAIEQAAPHLHSAAAERRRDELFKILEGPRPEISLRDLVDLGVGSVCFPDAARTEIDVPMPVWHQAVERVLAFSASLDSLDNPARMDGYLAGQPIPPRSLKGLLCLAAFYQGYWGDPAADTGSAPLVSVRLSQRSDWIDKVGRKLALANPEINHWQRADWGSRWVDRIARSGQLPSRREIYRYFRMAGSAGIEGGLLAWIAALAGQAPYLETIRQTYRALFEAWWEKPDELVHPPQLVDGDELQRELGLRPGPVIGSLLGEIGEAQAEGLVHSRDQALAVARDWLASHNNEKAGEGHARPGQ